jgi:hypothetical protein
LAAGLAAGLAGFCTPRWLPCLAALLLLLLLAVLLGFLLLPPRVEA